MMRFPISFPAKLLLFVLLAVSSSMASCSRQDTAWWPAAKRFGIMPNRLCSPDRHLQQFQTKCQGGLVIYVLKDCTAPTKCALENDLAEHKFFSLVATSASQRATRAISKKKELDRKAARKISGSYEQKSCNFEKKIDRKATKNKLLLNWAVAVIQHAKWKVWWWWNSIQSSWQSCLENFAKKATLTAEEDPIRASFQAFTLENYQKDLSDACWIVGWP